MVRLIRVTALLLLGAALTGCGKNDPEGGGGSAGSHTDAKANEWILEKMADEYLYNKYAKSLKKPNYNVESETFFKSLLSYDSKDNDGKHTGSKNYFYSYMERTLDGKSFSLATTSKTTYGLEFMFFTISNVAKVLYVTKNSPAYAAGLKRGDLIKAINGSALSLSNYMTLESGLAVALTVLRDGAEITLNVGSAVAMNVSPVFLDTVYVDNASGHKTGYLVYNDFDTGPKGPVEGDYTYDMQLKAVFRKFKAAGVKDLVLDLRYNPGGYLSSCNLLASMIVPASKLGVGAGAGEVFSISVYSDNSKSLLKFLPASGSTDAMKNVGDCNLNLSRLYVITGMWTASASEMIVNGLRPYMTVNLIGVATEGKNVGSYPIESKLHKMTLHPITFRIYNANNSSDYSNGFSPNTYKNELSSSTIRFYDLGDTDEMLLNEALAQISGVRSSASAAFTKSLPNSEEVRSSIESRQIKGLIGEPRRR